MPETIYRMIRLSFLRLLSSFQNISDMLGTGDATKTDEFSEKFQTAFDPPCLKVQNLRLKLLD